jgi:PPOX class probable F420-dependent enzyme
MRCVGSVVVMSIDADLHALASGKHFAALTTLMPDGQPQTQLMWVHADDDHLLINTEVHRQKYKNVQADPRVTVTVFNSDNPYQYVEARGRVVGTVGGDVARDQIDELSQKYMGGPYGNPIQSERVILQIEGGQGPQERRLSSRVTDGGHQSGPWSSSGSSSGTIRSHRSKQSSQR